jgi:hypothetical protein
VHDIDVYVEPPGDGGFCDGDFGGEDISNDESMIPYCGRHGCKRHIRGKPVRFGFKTWVATTRLGYCLLAELYECLAQRISEGLSLDENGVTKLTHVIQNMSTNTAFSVYCDNFFTSPTFLNKLQDKNIKVTSPIRQNRTDNYCPLADVKIFKKCPRGFYNHRLGRNDNICTVRCT